MEHVTVYDQDGKLLGVLENADAVSYQLIHNDLWTAGFTLPSGDPKNALCQAHNLVRVPDGARDIGLYRIVGMPTGEETAAGGVKTYSLEHVMATLLDDVLFGYHEIGGVGIDTAQVIRYILARQTVPRWALGVCEYSDQYAYKFENTSLLSALLSLGNVMTDEYTWDFDTSTTPWTVNLRHADATRGCGIHYRRNLVGIDKTMDASTLVTRLYLLGYGEGVNQLTVRAVNGGKPYIDADTVGRWGVKASVYADTRIEDAQTLKARGAALLERLKNPYIAYTASAIDLSRATGQAWDTHMPGKLVRVEDGEHGVRFDARIVSIRKDDVLGRPGEMEITIANAPRDVADSINTLADRMGISELYSQGATNLYSQQYADNADERHPATMRVYVPRGCVRINQMLLSFKTSRFRAYETAAAADGGTVTTTQSGGGDTRTSSAGGEATLTVPMRTVAQPITSGSPMVEGETQDKTGFALSYGGSPMSDTGPKTGMVTSAPMGDGGNAQMTTGAATGSTDTSAAMNTGAPQSSGGAKMSTDSAGGGNTGEKAAMNTSAPKNSGGAKTSTDSAGGGDTGEKAAMNTSAPKNSGGAKTSTDSAGGGNTGNTGGSTASAGSHSHDGGSHSHGTNTHRHSIDGSYTSYNSAKDTLSSSITTNGAGSHSHTVNSHNHSVDAHTHGMSHWHTVDAHSHSVSAHTHGMSHWHTVDGHSHGLGNHTHSMGHFHKIDDHSHDMTHRHEFNHYHLVNVAVTIPATELKLAAHTHTVSVPAHTHTLTLGEHTHGIQYGIYEGGTAQGVTLKVDGNAVPSEALGRGNELDIVGYLAKDADGRITRGTWHEIEIVPNGLTRIEANLFVQAFVQSVGGGDF